MEDDRALIAKSLMTQEEFDQEWFLSTDAAIRGAYYTAQLAAARTDGRITRVPYDPALPVDTDWDLGIGDATAIWFSQSLRTGEVRLIDYYEHSGEGLPPAARPAAWRVCLAPPLPAHGGPPEHPVVRAAHQRALPSLRVDAQLELHTLAAERREAVAQPVVPAVVRGREADPRRSDEAAHGEPVAHLRVDLAAGPGHVVRPGPVCHLAVPERLGAARGLPAP